MNILDIILLLLLAVGAYSGYKKGLFVGIVTFIAFIIAILSSFKLLHTAMAYLKKEFDLESALLPYISFISIFFIVFFLIFLMARAVKKVMNYSILGSIDSLAGAIVGIIEFAFGISLLLWLSNTADITMPKDFTKDSYLYNPLLQFAPATIKYISYVIPFQDIFPLLKKLLNN